MDSSIVLQLLEKELKKKQQVLSQHIEEFGDDSVVVQNPHQNHPQKWIRLNQKINVNSLIEVLAAVKAGEEVHSALTLNVSFEDVLLQFDLDSIADLTPKEKVIELETVKEPCPKFNNNTTVTLTGFPNGLSEHRGKVGDVGIIEDVDYVKSPKDSEGIPAGFSYLVRSPSFLFAFGRSLWVHESNLELVDVF